MVVGAWLWDRYKLAVGLSQEDRTRYEELVQELQRLEQGDLITIKKPGSYVNAQSFIVRGEPAETYMVSRFEPPNIIVLSGPGPLSRQDPGRFLVIDSWGTAQELLDAQTQIVRQTDSSWEQLAAWYYLQ